MACTTRAPSGARASNRDLRQDQQHFPELHPPALAPPPIGLAEVILKPLRHTESL